MVWDVRLGFGMCVGRTCTIHISYSRLGLVSPFPDVQIAWQPFPLRKTFPIAGRRDVHAQPRPNHRVFGMYVED
ncbi:hypothetical protein BD779DRAFT_683592 [Infundibulicybe gibba]|nr:hypothetical protein BD779DRAFT_683592 [Infundibulicybe gibba]